MSRVSIDDVRAWIEDSKINPQALDLDFLAQLEDEALSRIGSAYDTTAWADRDTTPRIVRVIIAKLYAGWLYDRAYSENQGQQNQYARQLKLNALGLINGILDGSIELAGATLLNAQVASFYPNDYSSGQTPTTTDGSLGPAKFSMGRMF